MPLVYIKSTKISFVMLEIYSMEIMAYLYPLLFTLIYSLFTERNQSFNQGVYEIPITLFCQKLSYIGKRYGESWLSAKNVKGTLRWDGGKMVSNLVNPKIL